MVKQFIYLILIPIIMSSTWTCYAENKDSMMNILSQAKNLYKKQKYNECIRILEANFAEDKLSHSWVVDTTVIEARNLLGKCYLKTKQYFLAYETFNFTAGYTTHDEFSFFMNDSFWLIKTRQIREYKDYIPFPMESSIKFTSEYSLYDLIVSLLDRFDSNRKVNVGKYINEIKWKPFGNILGDSLLRYYKGEINEEQILKMNIDNTDKEKVYFFIGTKKELDGNWKDAEKWYKITIEQKTDNFEKLLALSRLGMFSFKFKNKEFGQNETYQSSLTLINENPLKKYSVSNLFDDNLETVWAYNEKQNDLKDNSLIIGFSQEYFVKGFSIANGFNKSESLFIKNNRVKSMQLMFSDGTSQNIVVQDKMNLQKFPINKKTSFLKFIIKEIYEGSEYNDTCISELTVY